MRNEEIIKFQDFSKRSFLIGSFKAGMLSLILSRLAYLQLIKSDQFKTMSENNRIKMVISPPLRGNITDKFNNLIAVNHTHHRAMFERERLVDSKKVLKKLIEIINLTDEEIIELTQKFQQYDGRAPIIILNRLKWRDVSRIEVNSPDLPGIFITEGHQRYYPTGFLYSHIIGYVGPISEQEKKSKKILSYPDFRIGKTGIERSLENKLKGDVGIRKMEVNAHGLNIRELSRIDSKAGKNIRLTTDSRLQNFIYRKLPNKGSSAVVMSVDTGEILSLVSKPSYDPNLFTKGISHKDWNSLIKNPYKPLLNRTVAMTYPSGSVFKIIVMMAALKDGIPAKQIFNCTGYIEVGNRHFNCWKKSGHGRLNLVQALKHSCNCYIYNLALRIGIEKISQTARQFGFGEIPGIEIPGQIAGIIPDKDWKLEKYGKLWQIGDTLNSSIGQGFVQVTPLQLAIMTARIASNGKIIKPHLISNIEEIEDNQMRFEQMPISPKHFDIIKRGMEDVVNSPGGTAYRSRILEHGYEMAGKTGTSQVVSKKHISEDYSSIDTAWHQRNHGLFVGYAPINRPKFACSIVIEHGGSGPRAAAPLGRDILLEVQKLYEKI